jgi:hypothetical protein
MLGNQEVIPGIGGARNDVVDTSIEDQAVWKDCKLVGVVLVRRGEVMVQRFGPDYQPPIQRGG